MRTLVMLVAAVALATPLAAAAATPPYPALPVVTVTDEAEPFGVLDQADITEAVDACGTSGCNLYFPAGVYLDVRIELGASSNVLAIYGDGRGKSILRSPVFTSIDWIETIVIGDGAPDGVVIQDLSLDGRKLDQDPALLYPTGQRPPDKALNALSHIGINARSLGGTPIEDGTIQRVEIYNYFTRGIGLRNSPGWTLSDNIIHDIGCHVIDVPCGAAWETLPDAQDTTPGRKLDGFGIMVLNASDGVRVKRNRVAGATKIGIEVFSGGTNNSCAPTSTAPRGVGISDNAVSASGTGITVNGGCQIKIDGNVVSNSVSTGAEAFNVGNGFTCTGLGGDGLVMRDNVSIGNQGTGYQIACIGDEVSGADITFENNAAGHNCRGNAGLGEFDFGAFANAPHHGSDLFITGARSEGPSRCLAAMYIRQWDDVRVEDSALEGGVFHGLRVETGSGIDVRRTTIAGQDHPEGVVLGNNLGATYIHPSVSVSGYTQPVTFYSGMLGDGDDVAFCPLEVPVPAGCDP